MAQAINITIDIADWLTTTGKGKLNNLPVSIPSNTTVNGTIRAADSLSYVLLISYQFDGVQTGQVTYEYVCANQIDGGYAVDTVVVPIFLLSEKGQPINYSIESGQSTEAICNFRFISLTDDGAASLISKLLAI